MNRAIILLGCAVLLVAWPAQAQLGTLNPFTVKPGTTPKPFGADPHPFNNFHPAQPWSRWNAGHGDIIRYFEVPARTVAVPMMTVPAAESLPPVIEVQAVTIPGYRALAALPSAQAED